MTYKEMQSLINDLNKKSLVAHDPNTAMKFSQAALNAANAYATMESIRRGV